MDDLRRPFPPGKYGSLSPSSSDAIDPGGVAAAASSLGRGVCLIDDDGYECELVAAAIHPTSGQIAYVESRAKKRDSYVDVTIKINLRDPDGSLESIDVESYNPYFGCDVRLFKWVDDTALLIYREKHSTYACRFGPVWPPRFVEIARRWLLAGSVLAHVAYKAQHVQRLTFPDLEEMDAIPLSEAKQLGLVVPE